MALEIPLIHDSGVIQRLATGDTAHFPENVQIDGDAEITGDLTVGGILSTGEIVGYTVNSLRTVTNANAGAIVIGTPVYLTAADTVDKAKADASAMAIVAGLVADTSISASATGDIITSGTLTATTGQWDAVTGQSGGLTAGALYYLSPTTAGMLTVTAPSAGGHRIAPVGLALTTTEMLVRVHSERQSEVDFDVLTADEDIYVDTAGNDTTGDGSVGNPYLTIHRAAEHYSRLVPGNNNIIVHINAGVHDVTEKFSVVYPYGGRLNWQGEAEAFATPTIANIDAAATTGSAPYTSLEFIDFDLTLSGLADDPTGWFIRMVDCTGGTNPQGLNGLHEIVSWDGGTDVATCRVWRAVSTTELPSGAITVSTAWLIKSVLNFTADDHGIDIRGPSDAGAWDKIVVRGNDDAVTSSKRGIRLFNGAGIRADGNIDFGSIFAGLYVYEWAVALEIVANSNFYALRCGVSKCTSNGVVAGSTAMIHLGNTSTSKSVIHGVAGRALWAEHNSTIIYRSGFLHSCTIAATANTVVSESGSLIDVRLGNFHYDTGSGVAMFADDMGRIVETGATLSGYATDYSPTADTFGNNGSYIATA